MCNSVTDYCKKQSAERRATEGGIRSIEGFGTTSRRLGIACLPDYMVIKKWLVFGAGALSTPLEQSKISGTLEGSSPRPEVCTISAPMCTTPNGMFIQHSTSYYMASKFMAWAFFLRSRSSSALSRILKTAVRVVRRTRAMAMVTATQGRWAAGWMWIW